MKIYLNPEFSTHRARHECNHGQNLPCFENPSRVQKIIDALAGRGFTSLLEPADHGIDPILRVHPVHYVEFLQTIWSRWAATGREGDIFADVWAVQGFGLKPRDGLTATIGNYAFSADAPIAEGTYTAAYWGAQTALAATQAVLDAADAGFALTRPPGHHAHAALYGGYCYLNNAAIAAQAACDAGRRKVCVLDIDYHHGNGTQSIFYQRGDVLTVSLHGDPNSNFPYMLGFADEQGEGDGLGFNHNLPLPDGTSATTWLDTLSKAIELIKIYEPDFLIVALGVDTFEGDPISNFLLQTKDYTEVGRSIATIGLPAVFTMEGGYDIDPLGDNVVNVLRGFLGAA